MPNKKPRVEEVDSSSDSESDNSTYEGNEVLQVDFEGRIPIESDYSGIRTLLEQIFPKASFNFAELTDIIINQEFIGTVVVQSADDANEDEDDDDDDDDDLTDIVYGITTAFNISARAPSTGEKELHDYLLEKSKQSSCTAITNILSDVNKSVALLINERFVNIPPKIAVPMLENVQKELRIAAQKRGGVKFDHYLMILKYERQVVNNVQEETYLNSEEEITCEKAPINFSYQVRGESELTVNSSENAGPVTAHRRVVLLDNNQLNESIQAIKQILNNS